MVSTSVLDDKPELTLYPHGPYARSIPGLWRIDTADSANSTIVPRDTKSLWPRRSIQRRQIFQSLLQRYQTQILSGCSRPDCETPTCRSFRERTSKGPFRPYTVLSARALAAFLASQDQPEKGICPFIATKNLKCSKPDPNSSSDSRSVHGNPNDKTVPPRPQDTPKTEDCRDNVENRNGTQCNDSSNAIADGKEKDLKSFAQVLFDTVAMKRLFAHDRSNEKILLGKEVNVDAGEASFASDENRASRRQTQNSSQSQGESSHEEKDIVREKQRLAWRAMRTWRFGGREDTHAEVNLKDNIVTRADTSLAYFSLRNVFSVRVAYLHAKMDVNTHRMLQTFNRQVISPFASKSSTRDFEQYARCNAFFRRSTSYVCNTKDALLRSFVEWKEEPDSSITARSHSLSMITSILGWISHFDDSNFMISSLWTSLRDVYVHSPSFDKHYGQANPAQDGKSPSITSPAQTLNDIEAAHIVKIALAALIDTVADVDDDALNIVQQLRSKDRESAREAELCEKGPSTRTVQDVYDAVLEIMDLFDNELTLSLAARLAKAMASRHWMGNATRCEHTELSDDPVFVCHCSSFMTIVIRNVADRRGLRVRVEGHETPPSLQGGIGKERARGVVFKGQDTNHTGLRLIVEWMRTVLVKEWDGKPEILRCGAAGGAIEFLKHMYIHCSPSDIPPEIFCTPYLADRLDVLNFPVQWANSTTDRNMVHLLSYPFLFAPATLISYFRAINHNAMAKAFRSAQVNMEMLKKMSYEDKKRDEGRGEIRLLDRLQSSTSKYLVLDIRRNNILEDAMNQLWRRQPHELMKPLKVRMGRAEGEEGVDLGGIQQEFFRLAIAEALDPKYGAFTTDTTTKMSWFQPQSLEPCHMFEMVGILTSLAIYNGLTLPFTFPRALYRRISGLPCETIRDIEDGWPDLARGLQALLDWSDGDVEDVFMRRYTFSVDVFGTIVDTDMDVSAEGEERKSPHREKDKKQDQLSSDPPSPSSSDNQPMVTNANRHAFVRDYIIHLTDLSVRPQLTAFITGFRRCLNPKSHQLFTEDSLKLLVEGHTHISTHELEAIAKYDEPDDMGEAENSSGYHASHPTIRQFWEIVHSWEDPAPNPDSSTTTPDQPQEEDARHRGQQKIRALLEFVTASDRLPVGGASRIQFVIQRNGEGDERLPSSMTCFGRLLLPEFSGIEAMRRGLERAVEESKGFGLP